MQMLMSRECIGGNPRLAVEETGATNASIITYSQEDRMDGINLIPAWQ